MGSQAERNMNSSTAVFLRKHGWVYQWEKPMGYSTIIVWAHPKHGQMRQGHAFRKQSDLNRQQKKEHK